MKRLDIILSGSGGQGLILAGIILAEAALLDGINVVQTQSYGPEARGGASKSEVIVSDDLIFFPKVKNCDLLLVLTEKSLEKYTNLLKTGGTLLVDDRLDIGNIREDINIISIPILDTAKNNLNNSMVANIVALGCICKLTNIISKKSLLGAVAKRVPRGTEELNVNALKEGIKLIESVT